MSNHRQQHLNALERSHFSLRVAEERAQVSGDQFFVNFFTKCVVYDRKLWMLAAGLIEGEAS
jgi:hypothetical protein